MRLSFVITIFSALLLVACAHQYDPAPTNLTKQQLSHHFRPGDRVKVNVFDEPTLSGDYTVNAAGDILLPLTGALPVAGLTENGATTALKKHLEKGYMQDAKVAVTLGEQSSFVYVLGEVQKPGHYPLLPGMTVVQAVAQAGGYTYRADSGDIILRRQRQDYNKGYSKYSATEDTPLLAGDTITIEERYF